MQKAVKTAVFNFDTATTADVMFKNWRAVRNRMDLLANFRLMRKDKLDYETLRGSLFFIEQD